MLQDEILQTARQLATEKGYVAMSMEELASRVGISKPTLYSHFATKEDLIVAAAAQAMQRLIDIIEADPTGQTPRQRLVLLLRTAVETMICEGGTSFRPISPEIIQLIRSREETLTCIRRIDAAVSHLIQQALAQGEINPALDPMTIALALHALLHAPKVEYFSEMDRATTSAQAIADTLATIFEHGICRPTAS